MNYLIEINGFERWLEINYLPALSQLLWYKLMYYCNRMGWPEWFQVDNRRLMMSLQIAREASLIEHRDRLVNAGLIEFQRGKKSSPNRYKFVSFELNITEYAYNLKANSVAKSVAKTEVESVAKTAAIYKQKTKTKTLKSNTSVLQEKNSSASVDAALTVPVPELFERLWRIYPEKKGKGQVSAKQKKLIFEAGEVQMVRAIERYQKELEKDKDWRKPQNGSTFFNSGYVDYLDDNFVASEDKIKSKPVHSSVKNRFHNLEEHGYDYEKMMWDNMNQGEGENGAGG